MRAWRRCLLVAFIFLSSSKQLEAILPMMGPIQVVSYAIGLLTNNLAFFAYYFPTIVVCSAAIWQYGVLTKQTVAEIHQLADFILDDDIEKTQEDFLYSCTVAHRQNCADFGKASQFFGQSISLIPKNIPLPKAPVFVKKSRDLKKMIKDSMISSVSEQVIKTPLLPIGIAHSMRTTRVPFLPKKVLPLSTRRGLARPLKMLRRAGQHVRQGVKMLKNIKR